MARATQEYNLRVINPGLSKEWHPTKNGSLTPRDVTPGSNRKIWWICSKGHPWKAKIDNRNGGTGCPYCSKKAVSEDKSLQTVNPSLAAEWHPTKNGSLTPRDVTQYSNKKVWWICRKGHQWKAYVYSRSYGSGCPYCSGQKVCTDNCLETVNPDLAKQWHPTNNGNLTPKDVVAHSDKKVWWICEKGHQWQARISKRSNGTGCPYCARERRYSARKLDEKELVNIKEFLLAHSIQVDALYQLLIEKGLITEQGFFTKLKQVQGEWESKRASKKKI